jgi:hypothetical protein
VEAAAELAQIVKETGFGGPGLAISFWETEAGMRWWEKYGGSAGLAGHAAYLYEQRLVNRAKLDAEGLVPPRYYPPDMWAVLENRIREAEQRLLEDSDFREAVRMTLEEGESWDQRLGETRKMEQYASEIGDPRQAVLIHLYGVFVESLRRILESAVGTSGTYAPN